MNRLLSNRLALRRRVPGRKIVAFAFLIASATASTVCSWNKMPLSPSWTISRLSEAGAVELQYELVVVYFILFNL